MQSRGVGLAHVGQHRENNEDCWMADEKLGLYVVADGMGGHQGGDVASGLAISAASEVIRAHRELLERIEQKGDPHKRELAAVLTEAMQAANTTVHERSQAEAAVRGMGCTLTMLLIVGDRGVMAHVGDSRLYVQRGGAVHQLSQDHTITAELIREGALEPEQAETSRFRGVLSRNIGSKPVAEPELLRFAVVPGDRFLLCSDGLSNYLRDPLWLAKQLGAEDLEGIPAELVRFANEAGGADNITALVVEAHSEPSEAVLAAAAAVHARLQRLDASFVGRGMSLARQAYVISQCLLTEHEPGAQLATQEDPLPGLVLVIEGRLTLSRDGQAQGELTQADHFGARALLAPRASRSTVTAAEPTSTLTLTRQALQQLTRARPRLGGMILRRVGQELAQALDGSLAGLPVPPSQLP